MLSRDDLQKYLHDYLNVEGVRDHCPNGLQVHGKDHIGKIAVGVSANTAFFEAAVRQKSDACIVHHGLFWEKECPFVIDAIWKKRFQVLFDHDISLFAYHYPLDAHPDVGNNAQVLKRLGCRITSPFGYENGRSWGFQGELPTAMPREQVVEAITTLFGTAGHILPFGNDSIKTIGALVGGGSFALREAVSKGIDLFVTGELREPDYAWAREYQCNVIAPGHYRTEQFGVQALGEELQKRYGVETVFCDIPNPL